MRARLAAVARRAAAARSGAARVLRRRLLRRPAPVGRRSPPGRCWRSSRSRSRGRCPRAGPGRSALAGLAALTAWTALSLTWAPDGGQATRRPAAAAALPRRYLAAAIAVLAPAARPSRCCCSVSPARAPTGCPSASCLVGLEAVASAGDRLAYPLSYWNATGAFAALGLVLRAALAGDPDRPPALRAAAAAAGPLLALTLLLTFSRGAFGALAAGLAPAARPRPHARPHPRRAGGGRARRRGGRAAGRRVRRPAARSRERAPPRCAVLLAAMARAARSPRARSRAVRTRRSPWLRAAALAARGAGAGRDRGRRWSAPSACPAATRRRPARSGSPPCRATATRTGRSPSRRSPTTR